MSQTELIFSLKPVPAVAFPGLASCNLLKFKIEESSLTTLSHAPLALPSKYIYSPLILWHLHCYCIQNHIFISPKIKASALAMACKALSDLLSPS